MSSLDFEHDGRDFRIMSHHKTFAPSRVGRSSSSKAIYPKVLRWIWG
jgi:hypothetical protein